MFNKNRLTPIKGFSLFFTDGTRVYKRPSYRLIKANALGDYQLIPDGGDGINLKTISAKDALGGGITEKVADVNKNKRGTSSKQARKK